MIHFSEEEQAALDEAKALHKTNLERLKAEEREFLEQFRRRPEDTLEDLMRAVDFAKSPDED